MPLFHLAGIQTSCPALLTGGTVVFLSGRFDPAEVLPLIERERVRVWGSVPTMVSRVLDHPDLACRDVSSLRSVPMGGAAVSPELRQRVAASFPGVRAGAGSLYGLTEAGGVLAAGSGRDLDDRPGCVGRALPVVELRIAPAGPDGVGEIQARTPTQTDGYLGDPEPLADPDGWISTGDLGPDRGTGLALRDRPVQGHHHPRWREHRLRPRRAVAAPASGGARGRGRGTARRRSR